MRDGRDGCRLLLFYVVATVVLIGILLRNLPMQP